MLLLYKDKAKCLNGFPTTHVNDPTRGIVAHSKSNYRHCVVVAKSYHSKASFSAIFIKVKSSFSRNVMRASFLREEKKIKASIFSNLKLFRCLFVCQYQLNGIRDLTNERRNPVHYVKE